MTSYEYLNDLRFIDRAVEIDRRELKKLETIKVKSEEFERYKQSIEDDLNSLYALKNEAMDLINQVRPSELALILRSHYLYSQRWEDVARAMYYSVENIYVLRREAILAFDRIYNKATLNE